MCVGSPGGVVSVGRWSVGLAVGVAESVGVAPPVGVREGGSCPGPVGPGETGPGEVSAGHRCSGTVVGSPPPPDDAAAEGAVVSVVDGTCVDSVAPARS